MLRPAGACDEDRASVAMYYDGFLAAKAGIHIIDVSRIDGQHRQGDVPMRRSTSNLTVPRACRKALRLPAYG
jgi:hypothetical protein